MSLFGVRKVKHEREFRDGSNTIDWNKTVVSKKIKNKGTSVDKRN